MFNLNACFFPYAQNCSVLLLIELGGEGGDGGRDSSASHLVQRILYCAFF